MQPIAVAAVANEQITRFSAQLARKPVRRVCVEAGHIYLDEEPNGQHHQGLQLGSAFAEALCQSGQTVTKLLFVDDYNPTTPTLDVNGYLGIARELGFHPDTIVYESSLVSPASKIVEQLIADDETMVDQEGHTCTKRQNIRLRHKSGKIACCVLDAALYQKRLQEHDFNITILPSDSACEYKKQQRNVRRLLRLVGQHSLTLANVYFNPDGVISIGLPN